MKTLFLTLALLIALPLTAQEDEQPFFSISSSATWGSKDRPSIQVSAWGLESLEFRVYRIQDPARFFAELKDLHQFGGREPKPPRKLTWLERFHGWKNEWRYEYRGLIRQQFDGEAHTRISQMLDQRRESQATRRITHFTPLPLLNPQQVVSVWKQYMPKRGGWSYEGVKVDNPGKGAFLVEAANGDLRAYTVMIVTDLALITKQAPGRLVAYVADRASGAPIPNAELAIYANHAAVARMQSDANGIASTPLVLEKTENVVTIARHDADLAIHSPYGFNFSNQGANRWHGYIYTDRPVYRPGHQVDFKAIIRAEQGIGYTVPTGTIDFEVQNSEGTAVYQKKGVALSAMGSAWGQFTLPSDAALGYYSVIARSPNVQQMSGGFRVEEYKKPEYEVRVNVQTPRVLQGNKIKATIEARYYFGEPVANAKVTWVAHRSGYYPPFFYRDADYTDENEVNGEGDDGESGAGGDQVAEQNGKLDANGKLSIEIPTKLQEAGDFDLRIEARVTDQANREISGSGHAIATRGSFAINAEPDRYGYKPGETATFKIQARDYDAKPVATPVKLELLEWKFGAKEPTRVLASANGSTDSVSGDGSVGVKVPNTGSVRVRVTARTPEGRDVHAESWIWIATGDFETFSNGQDIQIFPDQKTYKPGDTAKLLVVSRTQMDHVFTTVEGRNVDAPRTMHPGAKSFTVEVPVKGEYAPNFFFSVSALVKGELHQGVKSIAVPATEKQLTVEIQPAKPQFKPGETAQYSVIARDSAGKPVSAELSLGVVDEAIYAIQRDQTPDIMRFFYGKIFNAVQTDTSLQYYFNGAAGKARMRLAELMRPSTALAQLKPERLIQPKVRKAFPDTAFWVANLITDANGRATARFDFPDSLTTWRATARAITRNTLVGSAVNKVTVRKNLMLRLAVPRFFTQGDEVVISAIVHNYLNDTKTARVSLELQGLEVVQGSQRDVTISSRGEASVDWRVRPTGAAQAVITGKALTDEESDAMALTLPVNPMGVKLNSSRSGVLTAESTAFDLPYPSGAAALGRKLRITVTPSIAGSLFGALDYLTSFPYGCTEQTMSSFLPNLVVAHALQALHVKSALDPGDLKKKTRAGIDRLYDAQHPDGGWGWWPTDDSSSFMTAYVVAGFQQARDLGETVKPESLSRGIKWLRTAVDKANGIDPDLHAYAAYAMRDDLEPVWLNRAKLSPNGLAFLGLALDQKNDARAAEIAGDIESKVQQNADEAHWQMDQDRLMGFYGDTSPEATALALKLLVHRKPSSALIPKAARWLVGHRNEGMWWNSTKQTAMVVYGLTDYLQQSGELNADFTATVSVNGRSLLNKHFSSQDALSAVPEIIDVPDTGSTPSVQITKAGSGRLYWSAREEYFSTEKKKVDQGSVSLNVIREYFRLTSGKVSSGKNDDRIVYDLSPLEGSLKTGDLLGVRVTVSGSKDWRYLLTEDPIPAGAEFVQRDDLYELRDPQRWWNRFYSQREFHDDRAAFFDNYFSGQRQYFYLLKITNAGKFQVSPARSYPMYQPEKLATTGAAEVTVQ